MQIKFKKLAVGFSTKAKELCVHLTINQFLNIRYELQSN